MRLISSTVLIVISFSVPVFTWCQIEDNPVYVGALGAALLAQDERNDQK